jgi:hypothetical protein
MVMAIALHYNSYKLHSTNTPSALVTHFAYLVAVYSPASSRLHLNFQPFFLFDYPGFLPAASTRRGHSCSSYIRARAPRSLPLDYTIAPKSKHEEEEGEDMKSHENITHKKFMRTLQLVRTPRFPQSRRQPAAVHSLTNTLLDGLPRQVKQRNVPYKTPGSESLVVNKP